MNHCLLTSVIITYDGILAHKPLIYLQAFCQNLRFHHKSWLVNSIQYCLKNSITTGRKSSDTFMAKCGYKELSSMLNLFGPPQANDIVWVPVSEKKKLASVIVYITVVFTVICVISIVCILPSVYAQSGELLKLTGFLNSLVWSGSEQLTRLLPQGWCLTWRHSLTMCTTPSKQKLPAYSLKIGFWFILEWEASKPFNTLITIYKVDNSVSIWINQLQLSRSITVFILNFLDDVKIHNM